MNVCRRNYWVVYVCVCVCLAYLTGCCYLSAMVYSIVADVAVVADIAVVDDVDDVCLGSILPMICCALWYCTV